MEQEPEAAQTTPNRKGPRTNPSTPTTTEIGARTGTKTGTICYLFFIYQS